MLPQQHTGKSNSFSRRAFFSSCAASVLALVLPITARASGIVSLIRIGKHGSETRLVINVSKKVKHKIIPLVNPYRLVIDISNAKLDFPLDKIPKNKGLIKKIRFGKKTANNTKINKTFSLSPQSGFNWRLVVDLEKTSRNEFFKSAKIKDITNAATVTTDKNAPIPKTKPIILKKPAKKKKPVIVLDPGHGGRDPGAVGISGVYEKNITLKAAKELKKKLVQTGRYKVFLTRERDVSVSLRQRVKKARAVKGDLFISLHADSIKKRNVRGLSVYTLSERASDREAAALATRENKADIIAGLDFKGESKEVTSILIDLAQRETMNLSAQFAGFMVNRMVKSVKLLRNTHRFAGFAVLKAPDIPSVLLEMGYLSNRSEEKLLQRPAYRAKLALAAVRSVDDYFFNAQKVV